jgi:hypothetical protein
MFKWAAHGPYCLPKLCEIFVLVVTAKIMVLVNELEIFLLDLRISILAFSFSINQCINLRGIIPPHLRIITLLFALINQY